jgi:hypothetical protein
MLLLCILILIFITFAAFFGFIARLLIAIITGLFDTLIAIIKALGGGFRR